MRCLGYWSDILNKKFDSEAEVLRAEAEFHKEQELKEIEKAKYNKAKDEAKAELDDYLDEIAADIEAIFENLDEFGDMLKDYNKKYGAYTLEGDDALEHLGFLKKFAHIL